MTLDLRSNRNSAIPTSNILLLKSRQLSLCSGASFCLGNNCTPRALHSLKCHKNRIENKFFKAKFNKNEIFKYDRSCTNFFVSLIRQLCLET
jgi:hypothetical protein